MPDLTKDAVLASCPFCGRETRVSGLSAYHVACNSCGATGPAAETEAGAIGAWNRRAAAPFLDGGEEELAKEIEGRLCQSPRLGSVCGSYRESDLRMVARGLTSELLPLITARIAQARAEGRDLLRRAVNGEVEICAGGMPLPPEGPCDCGAEDDEPCRAIHDHTEETTND